VDRAELCDLIARGSAADRAFADGVIRMKRKELGDLHPLLAPAAARAHAALRSRIRDGLRGADLRAVLEAVPARERDHFVEEMLGIAYPPLDEAVPGPSLIPYLPSGYDEIIHAFSATHLAASDSLLDIGSGLGKAVMLAELLFGAAGLGLELDPVLHAQASTASRALRLRATFACGDARTEPLPRADVVFMYLPFTGAVLETVMARVLAQAPRHLCAGVLDRARYPKLRALGEPQSWLQVYEVGNSSVSSAPST
jgi:SAM-dependent methyltransferase